MSDGKKQDKPAADTAAGVPAQVQIEYRPTRRKMPKSRASKTTRFTVAGAKGYMTAGSYDDGALGEIFLKLGKQGSTLAGVMDAFSIAVSIGLQYGVPLETYVEKFTNLRFEPAGLTDDPDVRMSASIMDYIFRRLALDHLSFEDRSALGIYTAGERQRELETGSYLADDNGLDDERELENLAQSAPSEPALAAPAAGGMAPAQQAAPASSASGTVDAEAGHEMAEASGADKSGAGAAFAAPAPVKLHSSAELFEPMQGRTADAPMCFTCGTKMRPAGSCFVCEGCGSTSGCS